MKRFCFRCDDELNRPHPEHANYIQGTDTVDVEKQESYFGMQHTPETKKELDRLCEEMPERNRQAIAAEMAHPNAPAEVEVANEIEEKVDEDGASTETAKKKNVRFSVNEKKFQHVRVESPNDVQDDPELALTYSLMENKEVQKTGLVCRNCVRPKKDEIIWGADE